MCRSGFRSRCLVGSLLRYKPLTGSLFRYFRSTVLLQYIPLAQPDPLSQSQLGPTATRQSVQAYSSPVQAFPSCTASRTVLPVTSGALPGTSHPQDPCTRCPRLCTAHSTVHQHLDVSPSHPDCPLILDGALLHFRAPLVDFPSHFLHLISTESYLGPLAAASSFSSFHCLFSLHHDMIFIMS